MSKTAVDQWDTTAANNTDVGGVSIAENCDMANLNNAAREMMAQIAAGVPTAGRVQTFTSSGTYTPDAHMVYCVIECVGGGGAGGSVLNGGGSSVFVSAEGGGSGGYSKSIKTVADIGVSKTVTIGAGGTAAAAGNHAGGNGGDTSVGTLCVGKGGSGGSGADGLTGGPGGSNGGVAGTGNVIALPGSDGGSGGFGTAAAAYNSGFGAASHLSGSARPSYNSAGNAGKNYGGGGSGAQTNSLTDRAGGAGAAGVVIITEYCTA